MRINFSLRKLAFLTLLALFAASLGAEPSSYPGLFRFRLPNGLELFVYEDHSLPLARIQLSFKAGALVQSPETAGDFHLLEHLIFGGEEASSALQARLSAIGATDWNGASSAEYLGFWLGLPSAKVGEGLSLWAELLAPEAFSPEAVEASKARVLEELRARTADPDAIYEAALTRRLFSKYPWRRDPAGSEKALAAATPESLARLKATWLLPNNAALFVGGDVDPEAVYGQVLAAFASWKQGPEPRKAALPAHPKIGVTRPTFLAYPDSSIPEGLALVELRYRGPDLQTDPAASYAADLWTALLSEEGGRFGRSIYAAVPKLQGPDSVAAYYVSQREGGILSVSASLLLEPGLPVVERVWKFKESFRGAEMNSIKGDPSYFPPEAYAAARRRLLDARSQALDSADGLVSELAFWWAAASADYFLSWPEAIAATGRAELVAFVDSYILKNLEIAAIRLNPTDYEREKKALAAGGFETVGPTNAFWWK